MLDVTVRVDDALLRAIIATAPGRAAEVVARNLKRLRDEADRRAAVNKQPDAPKPKGYLTLKEGLGIAPDGPFAGRVVERSPHGPFVEDDTRAHPIYPVHATYLHFLIGGADVFARAVQHPGTTAQPFMGPAADAVRPLFARDVADLFAPGGYL